MERRWRKVVVCGGLGAKREVQRSRLVLVSEVRQVEARRCIQAETYKQIASKVK